MTVIGVIGAGVMGTGVAQSLAEASFEVILVDVSAGILEEARNRIKQGLRMQKLLKRGASCSTDEIFSRLTLTEDLHLLKLADYIIENVTEDWRIKREVYGSLEAICKPSCIFAANTSAIPIARIASATKRPSQVIGLHFMNPVPVKKTVEVIRGADTSEQTIQATNNLLSSMGKESVMVNDAPGFVSNRVLMLAVNEAIHLLREGVASPEDIDKIFRDCVGHKMGPLETADLIGLDTVLLSIEVLYENLADNKFQPCPLLKEMVALGQLGRKSGQGFYTYDSVSR
jgi:3-hydroxybutyryl-CoA dehydrogenase